MAVPTFPLVRCDSTKGPFTLRVRPDWAPLGAPHLLDLVDDGVFEKSVVYRVVAGQASQFGVPESESLRRKYKASPPIKDDTQSRDVNPKIPRDPNFRRGYMSFAGGGPNTRKTDVFITYMTGNANGNPSAPWEVPVAEVIEGMDHVESFTTEYGDLQMFGGNAPDSNRIWEEGYAFLQKEYPQIDYIGPCTLVTEPTGNSASVIFLLGGVVGGLVVLMRFLRRRRKQTTGKLYRVS